MSSKSRSCVKQVPKRCQPCPGHEVTRMWRLLTRRRSLEWGLNPRPTHYECVALPLSYPGLRCVSLRGPHCARQRTLTPTRWHRPTHPLARFEVVHQDLPLLAFDADCGFCTTAATWLEARWPPGVAVARGAASVDDAVLAAHGLRRDEAEAAVCWLEAGEARRGHRAIAAALCRCGGTLSLLGRLLDADLLERPAATAYRLVARHRHRLPGASAACRPSACSSAERLTSSCSRARGMRGLRCSSPARAAIWSTAAAERESASGRPPPGWASSASSRSRVRRGSARRARRAARWSGSAGSRGGGARRSSSGRAPRARPWPWPARRAGPARRPGRPPGGRWPP